MMIYLVYFVLWQVTSARRTLAKVSETIPVLFCPGKKDVGPKADVSDYIKRYNVSDYIIRYKATYHNFEVFDKVFEGRRMTQWRV